MKGMMRFAASAFVASILTFSARAAEVLAEPLAEEEMTSAIVWVGETATDGLYLWSTAENWFGGAVPGESATVQIASGKNKPTVTANATVSKVELVGDVALDVAKGAILQADFLGWSGEATGTLSLGGAGKLLLRANSTFSSKVMSGGALSVASGATFATTLNGGDDPNIENVTLTFDNGAKWQSHGWLGLLGTVTVNNAGELTFDDYSGTDPSIKGTGKLVKKGAGALSLYGKGGTHETAVDVAEGELKLLGGKTFTGAITGSGALTVGSGESEEITFSGTFGTVAQGETSATYTGNLTLASGVTLTLSADTPTVIQNTVKGSGLLKVGKGSVTLKGSDNEVSSEVASGATLVLDTVKGANIDSNKTFTYDDNTNCRTVTNNGTLELRSGFAYFYIAGSGTTKVPGKDFLFGVGGVNSANAPFANNLTIAPDATLSVRSWANKEMSVGKLSSEGAINREGGGSGYLPSMTISGAVDKLGSLGQNVSVKLAANSTLGTVTGGTATYERAIAIGSGSTLTFSSSTPTVLKNTLTGSGTIAIASGKVTLAGKKNQLSSTVASGATLVLDSGLKLDPEMGKEVSNDDKTFTDSNTDCRTITNNGTLELVACYGYFNIAGSGTTKVLSTNVLFGIGRGNGSKTSFVNNLEVVDSQTTTPNQFRIRPWSEATDRTLKINGSAKIDGELVRDGGTGGETYATLTLGSGTTLSGSGKVQIPVSFDGGVLDASAGGDALTLEKAVTCTGENKVKVKLADSQLSKVKVFLTTSDGVLNRSQLALDSASGALAGTVFVETVVGSTHSFSLMKKPTMEGMPEAVTRNDEVMNKIYGALSLAPGVEKLTGVELWNTAGTVSGKTNLADVLTLFDGVAPWVKQDGTDENEKAGKVVAMYDFGVSDLTLKKVDGALKVLVCAKVANSSSASFNSATYADGTTVSLILTKVVKGVDEQGNATSTTKTVTYETPLTESQLAALDLTANAGELWFAVPMTDLASGTNNFTVEASK